MNQILAAIDHSPERQGAEEQPASSSQRMAEEPDPTAGLQPQAEANPCINAPEAPPLPPFWTDRPQSWFTEIECQFQAKRITSDTTRFYAVLGRLDKEQFLVVENLATNPPATEKYRRVKESLLRHFTDSQEQRFRKLVAGLELGHQRPSFFLAEMRRLGGEQFDDQFIETLWKDRLPREVQLALAEADGLSLDALAGLADRIIEIPYGSTPQPYMPVALDDRVDKLEKAVTKLADELAQLKGPSSRQSSPEPRVPRRLSILDHSTKPNFLVDTGADLSVIPATLKDKPQSSGHSEMYPILTPYLRFPMTRISREVVSTFIPSAFNMFHIVHLMDDTMRKNTYFKRQQDAWHPFISRIYFGIIFIIQTLRAKILTGKASKSENNFYEKFSRTYPPEALPLPGPLVTLFECIGPKQSESTLETVTPIVPEIVGPERASKLITFDNTSHHQLILPNIPLLLGFAASITQAQPDAIPDYSNPNTFTDQVDRQINGHTFTREAWTPEERSALMSAGMLYLAETDIGININFNLHGRRLRLPIPAGADDIRSIDRFLYLRQDDRWFRSTIQIMETYCTYFQESGTLGDCITISTVSPLITNTFVELSSDTPATNNANVLTRAFPDNCPFTLKAKHSTTEQDLPPGATMLAQGTGLNIKFNEPNIAYWNQLGELNTTRFGPYWNQQPVKAESIAEDTYKTVGALISKHFTLAKPSTK